VRGLARAERRASARVREELARAIDALAPTGKGATEAVVAIEAEMLALFRSAFGP
jgi:hypothetical protein